MGSLSIPEHPALYEGLPEDLRDPRFACKCCGTNYIDPRLQQYVEDMESVLRPLVITSGYRCRKHNQAVGGVARSAHVAGLAADIQCVDSAFRFRLIATALAVGIVRIGIYRNFVHIDIDRAKPYPVIWYG